MQTLSSTGARAQRARQFFLNNCKSFPAARAFPAKYSGRKNLPSKTTPPETCRKRAVLGRAGAWPGWLAGPQTSQLTDLAATPMAAAPAPSPPGGIARRACRVVLRRPIFPMERAVSGEPQRQPPSSREMVGGAGPETSQFADLAGRSDLGQRLYKQPSPGIPGGSLLPVYCVSPYHNLPARTATSAHFSFSHFS